MLPLQVEPTAHLSAYQDFLVTLFTAPIKIYSFDLQDSDLDPDLESDPDFDPEEPIEIGKIEAYRFDLSYNDRTLWFVADSLKQELCDVASFFLTKEKIYETSFSRYLFHIRYVFIEPKFRGRGYALAGLAIFLEFLARGEVVSCYPLPVNDLHNKYSKTKGKLIMKKYWSKLGLTKYSKKDNVLWQDEWEMPEWLRNNLFSSCDKFDY